MRIAKTLKAKQNKERNSPNEFISKGHEQAYFKVLQWLKTKEYIPNWWKLQFFIHYNQKIIFELWNWKYYLVVPDQATWILDDF